jgi:ABC-type sulfate transport system permease subunit
MLLIEVLFGLPGVVVALIVYPWIKRELTEAG